MKKFRVGYVLRKAFYEEVIFATSRDEAWNAIVKSFVEVGIPMNYVSLEYISETIE